MKKILFTTFLLFASLQVLIAQVPSQAELDKMMKEANALLKKYGNDSIVKKAIKDQQVTKTTTGYDPDPSSYGNVDNWKFPPKNTSLLASIPKKVFTKTELVGFLTNLYAQVSKNMAPAIVSSVQSISGKYGNDGNRMEDAAISGWYGGYKEEALLLMIKAAVNNPDNGLLLNNCAAMLNMSASEEKAIPLLRYVLQSYPDDAMLLNNLGQSYAGLGAIDTAMVYLMRCINADPEHPEACNTVGQIEAEKGNKEKAIEYLEKSIKGAYTKTAALKLRKIKQGAKLTGLIRPRIKLPEYFNLFKYHLPAQCISVDNAIMADAEHDAFRKMITRQAQVFGAKYAELALKGQQKAMDMMKTNGMGRKLKKEEFMAHPFYELCQTMAGQVLSEYQKDVTELNSKDGKQYQAAMGALEAEYRGRLRSLGFFNTEEERCSAEKELGNSFLPRFAYLTEEWQKKNLHVYRQYFDELIYWHYLALSPSGKDNFNMQFYVFVEQYLVMLGSVAQTKIILPCDAKKITLTKESNEIKEFECPLSISIPFIVGSFDLDCDKIAFSAGEGAIFSYEKNFKSKQSTISIGIGAKLEIGKVSVGPVDAKIGVSVGESLFVSFDGDNKVSDAGLKFGGKFSAGAEIKGGKEISPGKSIEVSRELANREAGAGYTIGINSGINFYTKGLGQ